MLVGNQECNDGAQTTAHFNCADFLYDMLDCELPTVAFIEATLGYSGDPGILDTSTSAYDAFATSFSAEVSGALGVDAADIIITSVRDSGSGRRLQRARQLQANVAVSVDFRVAALDAVAASDLATTLVAQAADPASPLRTSPSLAAAVDWDSGVQAAPVSEPVEIEAQWVEDLHEEILAEQCDGVLMYVAVGYQQSVSWSLRQYELDSIVAEATTEPNQHSSLEQGERYCVPTGTYIWHMGRPETDAVTDCCHGHYQLATNDGEIIQAGTNFDTSIELVFGIGISYNSSNPIQTVRDCTCQELYLYDGELAGNGVCVPHSSIAGLTWCKVTDPACGMSGCDAGNGIFGCSDFYFDYCAHLESAYTHVTANEGPVIGNVASAGYLDYFVFDAYAGLSYDIGTQLGTLSDSYMSESMQLIFSDTAST